MFYFSFFDVNTIKHLLQVGKQALESPGNHMPFYQKLLLAGLSGAVGGVVGTPGDLINVRMQNDVKVAPELRRK